MTSESDNKGFWREVLTEEIDVNNLEDERRAFRLQTNRMIDQILKQYTFYGIVGGSAVALFTGFVGAIAIISRKKKIALGHVGAGVRALSYGTALCAVVSFTTVWATKKVLGVRNMEEFSDYLRVRIKPKSDKIKSIFPQREIDRNIKVTEQELKELEEISSLFKNVLDVEE